LGSKPENLRFWRQRHDANIILCLKTTFNFLLMFNSDVRFHAWSFTEKHIFSVQKPPSLVLGLANFLTDPCF
jgi:hypothetical protein